MNGKILSLLHEAQTVAEEKGNSHAKNWEVGVLNCQKLKYECGESYANSRASSSRPRENDGNLDEDHIISIVEEKKI